MHDQFLGLHHIYKTYRHADDQFRIQLSVLDQLIKPNQCCRRISDGKNQLFVQACCLVHAGCGAGGAIFFGNFCHILIGHKAVYLAAVSGKSALVDSRLRHLGIGYNAGTVLNCLDCFFHCIFRKTEILRVIEICTCVNAALYHQLRSRNQRGISKLLCNNLKASFFYVHRLYIFKFYLHLFPSFFLLLQLYKYDQMPSSRIW